MILAALAAATTMLASDAPPLGVYFPVPPPGDMRDCGKPTVFKIRPDGSIWRESQLIERSSFVSTARAAVQSNVCHAPISLQPDASTPFNIVLSLMRMLRAGGLDSIGLIDPN